jgi:hypothetical protein
LPQYTRRSWQMNAWQLRNRPTWIWILFLC